MEQRGINLAAKAFGLGRRIKFVFVFGIIFSCGQEEELQYYPSGSLKAKYQLDRGKRDGKGYQYYENGSLMQLSEWKEGVKHGVSKSFYENGQNRLEAFFVDGLQEGVVSFYDSLGTLLGKQSYENNGLSGPFHEYYSSGAIRREGSYFNSGLLSVAYEYFESGEHKSYALIRNDSLLYKKDFRIDGTIESCYFTVKATHRGSDYCFELMHSIIPKDDLAIQIEMGMKPPKESLVSEQLGNRVCVERKNVKGGSFTYLCEILVEDSSVQGCAVFEFDFDDLDVGEFRITGSTVEYPVN